MKWLRGVVTVVGAASVGIGLLVLLDAYWRWIGVALGYPPMWSGSVGGVLLAAGIACLLAGRQATLPGGDGPAQVPNAPEAKNDDQS
jgi:hypothetical protein